MKWSKKIIVVILFVFSFLIAPKVQAISSKEIFKRILVNNFQYCYSNALVSELTPNNYSGKLSEYISLFNEGFRELDRVGNYGLVIPTIDDDYNHITFTANYGGPMDGARIINCHALFFGDKKNFANSLDGYMSGLFDIYNVVPAENNTNQEVLNSFMNGMLKYNIDTEETSEWEYCYSAYVKGQTTAAQEEKIGSFCRSEDSFPLKGAVVFFEENSNYKIYASINYPDLDHSYDQTTTLKISISDLTTKDTKKCYDIDDEKVKYRACGAEGTISTSMPTGNQTINLQSDPEWKKDVIIKITRQQSTGETSKKITYKKDNSKWKDALAAITKDEYKDNYSFSDADKYEFYKLYLSTYYKNSETNIISNVCQNERPNVLADKENNKFYIWAKGSGWCLADLDNSKIKNSIVMTVFSTSQRYKLDKVVKTVAELIELMGELDYDNPDIYDEPGIIDDSTDNDNEVTCASSGGAESLGWIVCPILSWMGRASNDLYDYYIKPALNVKPALFDERSGENDDVKDAWSIFQNIANIVFVILFLIVIFSQLTGVGIDNYGIKKILPKLIVAAILVNISYYICLIFIDLSNIVGNGIQNMFNGMSSSLTINSAVIGGENIGSEILSTSVTGAVLLGALVLGGVAVWQNPAILLTLLISGLGVVISILFLFLILAAREAAIVVLTVISPLAFVCYILPNTKNLFDKWRKMGEGLLLVYPICGLLVGGGSYVSKLLLASGIGTGNDGNGSFGAFSAMLISVVPIFFIPTVLRSSFAAMGNLGAKISGFGQRLSTGSQRFLREREGYKNAQKMGLERRTRIRAGLNKDGQLTARGERMANRAKSGFGRLIGSDKRRAALISQAKRDISTSEAAGASLTGALARAGIPQADALPDSGSGGELGTTFAAGTENAYYGGQFLEAASRNDITGMNSAIEAMRASGMKAKDIAKIVRYGQNHGYYNGLNANTRSTWMRDLSKKYGNDFLATDFELNHFAATGGAGNGGVLGNYGVYAGTNTFGIDDVKPEDILKLSGDSLAGMISSGKIDQGMAQRVMAMNPNISADKRIMLGALASGAVGSGVNVEQFKNDAKALASNRNASSTTITPSGSDSLATLVSRWTAPTAQRATVVQEFFGEDDRQIRPVDVSIAHGNNGTVGSGPNAGAATAGETFMVRGQHGDVTFTQGNDGQWRDENGRVVEDFDRFRRGINEFRANRNNSQNGNNANAGQNNSQPQNPKPRDNTPNNA